MLRDRLSPQGERGESGISLGLTPNLPKFFGTGLSPKRGELAAFRFTAAQV